MTRVIHTGQALVDVVIEVPDLPARGQNVMADVGDRLRRRCRDGAGRCRQVRRRVRARRRPRHRPARRPGPAALQAEGVACVAAPVADRDTGICVVLIEPSAERTFVTTLGAERQITVESLATSAPRAGDLVCVTGFSLALDRRASPSWPGCARSSRRRRGPRPGFGVRRPLPLRADRDARAHRRLVEQRRGGRDAPAALDRLRRRRPDLVTSAIAPLLRGTRSRSCATGRRVARSAVAGRRSSPGFPQTPVDTNGAGDTHTGALLAEVAAGTPWVEGCRRANAAAAIKVTRRGPATAPTAAEVDAFLADADGS